MPKRPPCHSHSCTATMIGCHHTAISTVTHNIAVHKHTHVYKCMQAHRHTHARTHSTNTRIHRRIHSHTHTQDPWLWKSAPASTTLTTKSLLSLQLFLHWSLTTHQKSLSLWEQHETTASSPLDATCHIKYLIICYSIFPIKLEMFTMHIRTINYYSVVYANWDDKAGLAARRKKKSRKKKNKNIALLSQWQWGGWGGSWREWSLAVVQSWFLEIKSDHKQRGKRDSERDSYCTMCLFFLSSLVEQELTFLALAAVSKQKAAMWWVWLAADGGEISGRAVRWMPSWPACDVQFVARASLGRKALKILLAVTQREMCWFFSKNPPPKKTFPK